MKEPIGKWNLIQNHFPKKVAVGNDTNLPITEDFNNYFTKIGPKLVSKIENWNTKFCYMHIKIEKFRTLSTLFELKLIHIYSIYSIYLYKYEELWYIKKCNSMQPENPASINELKNAFFLC